MSRIVLPRSSIKEHQSCLPFRSDAAKKLEGVKRREGESVYCELRSESSLRLVRDSKKKEEGTGSKEKKKGYQPFLGSRGGKGDCRPFPIRGLDREKRAELQKDPSSSC